MKMALAFLILIKSNSFILFFSLAILKYAAVYCVREIANCQRGYKKEMDRNTYLLISMEQTHQIK